MAKIAHNPLRFSEGFGPELQTRIKRVGKATNVADVYPISLEDVLTFLLKVTRIRYVHFTLHLVKQAKNSIYDITNQFE